MGSLELRALQESDDVDERYDSLRRTGRVPAHGRTLPAGPQLHAKLPAAAPTQRADRARSLQHWQQPDGVQHPAKHPQRAVRTAAELLGSKETPDSFQAPVLTRPRSAVRSPGSGVRGPWA